MKGFAGKILKIDLSKKNFTMIETPKEWMSLYLGGDGFGTKLLYDNLPAKCDPLGEKNVIVISPCLFSGLPISTAGKTIFHFKSPLTDGYGESVMGGAIGAEIRQAGYDSIVITGKAKEPSYIYINNENIEIRSAKHLWGKSTRECPELIKKELKTTRILIACIGQGGENLVKFATVDCEDRQAGRSGVGTVMGAKNLKAVAVVGDKDIPIAHPQRIKELATEWVEKIKVHPTFAEDTKYGTGEFLEWMSNDRGTLPTRNWKQGQFEGNKTISPYYWAPKYSKKNKACLSCLKPCGQLFEITEGKYKGTAIDGPEYETLFSLGSCCGNSDIEALSKANELCDIYGIDTISAGGVIGFAMELYERGILTEKDIGMKLNFGNSDAVPKMVEMIALRKGIGNILAEGVRRASEKIGKGSENFAIHVKGQEPPAYDVRGIKGMGLAFATSPRGACHLRSGAYGLELTGKWWKFSGVDRFSSKNKGTEIKTMEDLMTVYDCLGVCKFSRHLFFLEGFPPIMEAVTGKKYTEDELLKVGERVNNLKKLINLREGFTRKDDSLPKRIMSEPIPEGPAKGSYIKPEELEEMLSDYYNARGWDKEGAPTKEKLKELGI